MPARPPGGPAGSRLAFSQDGRLVIRLPDGSLRPQATGAGFPITPDWSSRGTIVYTRRLESGAADLFALRVGGRPRKVARNALSPSWSPDGRRIVFTRRSRAGLFVVSARGGRPRQLTAFAGHGPVWSPDGKRIAFYRGRSIYAMRSDGSRIRRLYTVRGGGVALNHLSWQPRQR